MDAPQIRTWDLNEADIPDAIAKLESQRPRGEERAGRPVLLDARRPAPRAGLPGRPLPNAGSQAGLLPR